MKNQLLAELLQSKLNLDNYFNISINHRDVRLMADYSVELENQITELGFKRKYILYDELRLDMLEYVLGNLQIVLNK